MKVIDLLNKIANGEEVPKKIKWEDTIYAYSDYDKDYLEFPFSEEEYSGLFNMKDSILTQFLNDEVEIIEDTPKEDKKIEKFYFSVYQDQKLGGREVIEPLETKINEIIDKINGEE